jgi:hypothetical protein
MAYLNAAKIAEIRDLLFPAQLRRAWNDVLAPELQKIGGYFEARVPTAGEVSGGSFIVSPGFVPVGWAIQVYVTATGVIKQWDGAAVITGSTLVIDNTGAVDWAATDTVMVQIWAG